MDRPPVVICRQLCKNYGSAPVVRNLDLAIMLGTCYGLLGPNGAGKTTTLRMLLGLWPPTSGTLEVFGKVITANPREIRARTGVVPQANNLDPDFTVAENLRVYAQYFRLGGPEDRTADRSTPENGRARKSKTHANPKTVRRHEAPSHHRPGTH